MTDTLNLSLWVARRAEQGTLQAHADYVVREIKLLEQAVKYEADLVQQALDSRKEIEAEVKKYHDAWLEAEAQVVDLEAQVEGCLAVIATERDEVLALRRKLEEEREAVDALASAFGCECNGKAECVLAQIISEYQMRRSLEGRIVR